MEKKEAGSECPQSQIFSSSPRTRADLHQCKYSQERKPVTKNTFKRRKRVKWSELRCRKKDNLHKLRPSARTKDGSSTVKAACSHRARDDGPSSIRSRVGHPGLFFIYNEKLNCQLLLLPAYDISDVKQVREDWVCAPRIFWICLAVSSMSWAHRRWYSSTLVMGLVVVLVWGTSLALTESIAKKYRGCVEDWVG